MSENYGSFDDKDTAEGGETRLKEPYRFKSVKEYADSKQFLTIEYGVWLSASKNTVPENLKAVGVTVGAWGKFVADMNSAITVGLSLNVVWWVVAASVILWAVLTQTSNLFIIPLVLSIAAAVGLDNYAGQKYPERQLPLCCEEMGTRCDATLCAVIVEAYASTDESEYHIVPHQRTVAGGDPDNPNDVVRTAQRQRDLIPRHLFFTTIAPGRPAKNLV
jgi:hypothetical protein